MVNQIIHLQLLCHHGVGHGVFAASVRSESNSPSWIVRRSSVHVRAVLVTCTNPDACIEIKPDNILAFPSGKYVLGDLRTVPGTT